MTAQEMFEKLGYSYLYLEHLVICTYIINGSHEKVIRIDKRGVEEFEVIKSSYEKVTTRSFTHVEEHKAIHQQMKESGWV